MHHVSIEEATVHIASVLGEVLQGEEIIITDHEKPVAKVIPLNGHAAKRGLVGSGKGDIIYIAEDFDDPLEDFEEYA